jgi:hypothetical protein
MYSKDEFEDMIDNMVPKELKEAMERDMETCHSFAEIRNLCERGRTYVIKQHISSTHQWHKATSVDAKSGMRVECFWCEKCNIRASTFDHVACLSIISKVKDNFPSYTVHNEYLMYTCEQVRTFKSQHADIQCVDCGIPEKAKTDKCHMMD